MILNWRQTLALAAVKLTLRAAAIYALDTDVLSLRHQGCMHSQLTLLLLVLLLPTGCEPALQPG
jgi:hypothetical protein